MWPAIALAYENAELDLMDRMPRSAKRDHLVTVRLICFSYLQIGFIEFSSGQFTYFYILNDYGFKFSTVAFLN
jgi:sodium/potassium-transporting ATPase subunit alpha